MPDDGVTSGLFLAAPGVIRGRIMGTLANKSNSRRPVFVGKGMKRRMLWLKEPAAETFGNTFAYAVEYSRARLGSLPLDAEKLYLRVDVWPDSMRRDLDAELVPDELQRNGIIRNDRAIWSKYYQRVAIDKVRPRIEFEVGVLVDEGKI